MQRQRLQALILVVVSTLVGVLTLEVGLALFMPQPTLRWLRAAKPPVTGPSDILPYKLKPNATGRHVEGEFDITVRINSQGYRGPEFHPRKSGQYRILAIGDSFTFGYGVLAAEAYPARLEERTNGLMPGRRVEVINAGFAAGYYPDTYYLFLRDVGLELEPDLVLVGFFIGNDIDHDKRGEHVWSEVDENGLPTRIESPGIVWDEGYRVPMRKPFRWRYPVIRDSHVVQGLFKITNALRPKPIYLNHFMYRKEYLERTDQAVSETKRMFTAMAELAKSRGVPFVVVMIPTRVQLRPEEYPFADYDYLKDYDLDKPQRIFAEFFEEQGISFLDLLPALRREAPGSRLYYQVDRHLTKEGHEVASRYITEFLFDSVFEGEASPAAPASESLRTLRSDGAAGGS